MTHDNLTQAKRNKNDEFYTQYFDIEKEVSAYIEYDKNVFKNKTILLPCDDPEWSNFTKFFAQNFERFELKKLISTSYASKSKSVQYPYQPSLFEKNDKKFDPHKSDTHGKIFILDRDNTGDGKIDIDDLSWSYLDGDGSYDSSEVIKLRNESDVIVTNPPFSLFKEFFKWVMHSKKKFLIIGTLGAITYKEIFPYIKDNKVWLGNNAKVNGGAMFYEIPEYLANPDQVKEEKLSADGKKIFITRVAHVRWFTNIEHGRKHQSLSLMTKEDVVKYGLKKEYDMYLNYDAIEVPMVKFIPSDYDGLMGVPVSFLDKHCHQQFIIEGMAENEDLYKLKTRFFTIDEKKEVYEKRFGKKGNYDLNASGVILEDNIPRKVFSRIFIRKI